MNPIGPYLAVHIVRLVLTLCPKNIDLQQRRLEIRWSFPKIMRGRYLARPVCLDSLHTVGISVWSRRQVKEVTWDLL